jgi:TPR repeat protein
LKPLYHYLHAANIEETEADAQYNIGMLYHICYHVEKNHVEAYRWFTKAVGNGHLKAVEKIARLYYKGYGVDQDYLKAHAWYKKAANYGDTESQFRLGLLYNDGWAYSKITTKLFNITQLRPIMKITWLLYII